MLAPRLFKEILARRLPFSDIKIFSSHEPVHSTLFRPWRHKVEFFANTIFVFTWGIKLFAKILIFMIFHWMAAKTLRMRTQPWTLWFLLFIPIGNLELKKCYINFAFNGFYSMIILMVNHASGSNSQSKPLLISYDTFWLPPQPYPRSIPCN